MCSGDRGIRERCKSWRLTSFFYYDDYYDQTERSSEEGTIRPVIQIRDMMCRDASSLGSLSVMPWPWGEHIHILAVIRLRVRCRRLRLMDVEWWKRGGFVIAFFGRGSGVRAFLGGAASSAAIGEGHGLLCSFCTVSPARHLPSNILDCS